MRKVYRNNFRGKKAHEFLQKNDKMMISEKGGSHL